MQHPKIRLVSFADGPFGARKPGFEREAAAMDLFDDIRTHDLQTLDPDFRARHGAFMRTQARGFGYWIWKPQIVLQTLRDCGHGDVLVYADVGFTLNPGGRARLREYVELAQDSEWKMLSFQNTQTEYKWTKMDVAARVGVERSVQVLNTSQLAAGLLVLGNTADNRRLLEDWVQIAVEDGYRYSDDSPSERANHPEFVEHRHDASISSLLRKIRGTAVTHYEVRSYHHFERYKPALPAWATRSRV